MRFPFHPSVVAAALLPFGCGLGPELSSVASLDDAAQADCRALVQVRFSELPEGATQDVALLGGDTIDDALTSAPGDLSSFASNLPLSGSPSYALSPDGRNVLAQMISGGSFVYVDQMLLSRDETAPASWAPDRELTNTMPEEDNLSGGTVDTYAQSFDPQGRVASLIVEEHDLVGAPAHLYLIPRYDLSLGSVQAIPATFKAGRVELPDGIPVGRVIWAPRGDQVAIVANEGAYLADVDSDVLDDFLSAEPSPQEAYRIEPFTGFRRVLWDDLRATDDNGYDHPIDAAFSSAGDELAVVFARAWFDDSQDDLNQIRVFDIPAAADVNGIMTPTISWTLAESDFDRDMRLFWTEDTFLISSRMSYQVWALPYSSQGVSLADAEPLANITRVHDAYCVYRAPGEEAEPEPGQGILPY